MKPLKVASIQTLPEFGKVAENTAAALSLIPSSCDLAVLPELFNTGYQFRSRDEALALAEDLHAEPGAESTLGRLIDHAAASGTTLVAGMAERHGDHVYNSAVLVRPEGSREVYRKVHLFWDEKTIFEPGDLGFPVFTACGTRLGLMVCYDWLYPEAARTLALAGAEVLCHPSNLVLPWCPEAMVTRCLENRVFAVTSNRIGRENRTGKPLEFIGMSQVVSPRGEILDRLEGDSPGAAVAAVDLSDINREITPRNHLWRDRRPESYGL